MVTKGVTPAHGLGLAISVADQSFEGSKSLGILNLSAGLLQQLASHPAVDPLHVLANRGWDERLAALSPAGIHRYDYAIANHLARMYWDQVGVYGAARRTGQPWLLLTKGFAPLVRRGSMRLAVVMHDAMWDHYERHYPEEASGLEHRYFRRSYLAALRHADLLLTNSAFTRDEIVRIADREGIPPPPTRVMGIGFQPPPAPPPRPGGPGEILVLINRLPHKRADLAIEWMDQWSTTNGFSGTVHWVGSLPTGLRIPDRTGWVRHPRIPDAEYQALLCRVRCMLYTSTYEGFGMPPVEATMAGACPVYSDLPATREVMQGAGCAFDNASFSSFGAAMDRALATGMGEIATWREALCLRHAWPAVADRVVDAMTGMS